MKRFVAGCAALVVAGVCMPARAGVERPPQFIIMAFDNCTELERWKEFSDFSAEMNKAGDRVHFTFFVSGTNFVANERRQIYQGPRQQRGYSSINFGGPADDVRQRIAYINDMRKRGHEIASHAVGHFDGRAWSKAEWSQEFHAYNEIFSNIAKINDLPSGFDFPASEVVGFRAPYLAKSPGLYTALQDNRFRYDTSGDSHADEWPAKKDGIWRFNLVGLTVHGTRRATLSMDYNFLIAQSMGFSNSRHHAQFREQMLQTYLDYFKANYSGNRAPLHIGHHFTSYQGGVYNQALKAFARKVCDLPEVRCATYVKLADFMDGLDAATLKAYAAGDFSRASAPMLTTADAFKGEPLEISSRETVAAKSVKRANRSQ
ncbi:MAG: polysaccharide deacetylase family protein [Rhizobiales bacterium]|nr:polysaccharide deacetylase family protein [Hyphomicrobiales bacterium]